MITTSQNGDDHRSEYRRHMEALDALARRLEQDDLDPDEAVGVCRTAEAHYEALDRILSHAEGELADIRKRAKKG
jgi:exonuclease VII small subunit